LEERKGGREERGRKEQRKGNRRREGKVRMWEGGGHWKKEGRGRGRGGREGSTSWFSQ